MVVKPLTQHNRAAVPVQFMQKKVGSPAVAQTTLKYR